MSLAEHITDKSQKKRGPVVRARGKGAEISPERREKASQALERYLPAAAKAWIDGLGACLVVYNGATKQYELSDIPDHRERRENAKAIWENVVGRPIERSMQVTGNYEELSELITKLKQSPEAQRLIAAGFFSSLLSTDSSGQSTEGKDSAPTQDSDKKPDSGQKTG